MIEMAEPIGSSSAPRLAQSCVADHEVDENCACAVWELDKAHHLYLDEQEPIESSSFVGNKS